ncbi:MAG: DUF4139 domain-containing protein [Myxococcales bacterium]|nr:DUF4139 domain-containing protein [Myxococcales bacterium]
MSEPRDCPMPVRKVTAYEDRAELTRTETIELPPGRHRLRVPDVTPLAGDAHLDARVDAGPATVEHLRAVRRRITDPQRAARRVTERDDARADAHAAADDARHARARRDAARARLARYLHDADRAIRAGQPADPAPAVARLEARLDAAEAAVRAAATREHDAAERLARLEHLAAAHDPGRVVCDLELQLHVDASAPITLTLTQIVPCALWRPAHTARLVTADGRVEWTALGTLWQHTGEDWRDIELTLSTARPAAGARLPDLHEDRLRAQPRADKKRVVVAHREEAIATDQGDAALPGVDDGGEARTFRARDRVDIPSDGRPHRVELGCFDAPATIAHVTRPALAEAVFELARLQNTASWPILAGPVELRRDTAFTGTGDITYVGPGERFELAFGSDDRYTVRHRRLRRLQKRTIGRDRTVFVTETELIYGGADIGEVVVELQMPISELADLEVVPVDEHCTEGRPHPDADGIVHLPVTCRPGEPCQVRLGFRFEHGSDVVMPDPW